MPKPEHRQDDGVGQRESEHQAAIHEDVSKGTAAGTRVLVQVTAGAIKTPSFVGGIDVALRAPCNIWYIYISRLF